MKQLQEYLFKPLYLSISDKEEKLIIIHSIESSESSFLDDKRSNQF